MREPWKRFGRDVVDSAGMIVAVPFTDATQGPVLTDDEMVDRARRIAACVNACVGIPTESLELLSNEEIKP